MTATLYTLSLSPPGHAARLALERKGVPHRAVNLMPGMHPVLVRALGFRGRTVPALRLDGGERVQGSRAIPRALERLRPDPPLLPADPAARAEVERAELWGERELQTAPRRLIRRAACASHDARVWIARDEGLPAPSLVARTMGPVAGAMARVARADDAGVRETLAALPAQLDRVDDLIAGGVIGGEDVNVADLQIGTSVRALFSFDELAELLEDRPAAALARRVLPAYPGPVPRALPPAWIPSRAARVS